jgi:hypothetical protein
MLDIDEEYLQAERPKAYDDKDMLDTAALADGKDYLTEATTKL